MFFKVAALKNFAISIGKHLCWSLFLTRLKAKACNVIEKRLKHSCLPGNIPKFFRTIFFCEKPPVSASVSSFLWHLGIVATTGLLHFTDLILLRFKTKLAIQTLAENKAAIKPETYL